MTRQQLAQYVHTAPPRVLLMIEAIMQAQGDIEHYDVGMVELHFAQAQVKVSLKASLGCYKIDKFVTQV